MGVLRREHPATCHRRPVQRRVREMCIRDRGETETLTATVKPDNADNRKVTWSSDKTEIATVDGAGKVLSLIHIFSDPLFPEGSRRQTRSCRRHPSSLSCHSGPSRRSRAGRSQPILYHGTPFFSRKKNIPNPFYEQRRSFDTIFPIKQ